MKKIVRQVLGIDVAQKELVVCLGRMFDMDWALELYSHRTFPNTDKGFAAMVLWVKKLTVENIPVRYVMEATGVYHEALAYFLEGKGHDVSVVLPNKISNYFRTLDVKTITDKTASEAIARFGLERKLDNWHCPKEIFRGLKQLTRERDQIVEDRTISKNQLHAEETQAFPNKKSVARVKARIKFLDTNSSNKIDMNKKLKICLNVVCVLFALSCSNSKESSSENNSIITVSPDENLKSYYDTLSLIKTPLKINWQYWDSTIQRYMIANGPIKGSNIFDNPFAKVFDNKNYKAIIFISPDESGSPALVTFDRNDSPIDTIFLLGDISSNNPEQWTIEEAEIMENQTIQLLDSISQWKLTSDGARIPDTKKSTIEVKKYKISKSGEIKEKK